MSPQTQKKWDQSDNADPEKQPALEENDQKLADGERGAPYGFSRGSHGMNAASQGRTGSGPTENGVSSVHKRLRLRSLASPCEPVLTGSGGPVQWSV